jgi:hypothetical protein
MRFLPLLLIAACANLDAGSSTVDMPMSEETFEALPTMQAPPTPQELSICKPPKIIIGQPARFTVSGLQPGETAIFLRGRGTDNSPMCFGAMCTNLVNPHELGRAVADANGDATLVRRVPDWVTPGVEVAVQAFARRGAAGAQSVASNVVETTILGSIAEEGDCADPDVCADAADLDLDGVPNVCDVCPSFDDNQDGDGDGHADACDEINVTPDSVHLTVDPNEMVATTVTLENQTGAAVVYQASASCSWLSFVSGGPITNEGSIPSGGVAQLQVRATATAMTPGDYSCQVTFNTDDPAYATLGVLDIDLTVEVPGFDVVFPGDATTPTGIDGPVSITVTNEAGAGAAGMSVQFSLDTPPPGVVISQSGGATYTTTTNGSGYAGATIDTPAGFEGTVAVDITVTNPGTGVVIGETRVQRDWTRLQGNIFFWELWGSGGNIRKMPADFSSAPTVFRGTSYNGRCSGCHTVSPSNLPTTGTGALFTQDRVSPPYQEQLINTATGALITQFSGDSSDNDFSPDSSKIAWSNGNIMVYNVTTGTSAAVAGANTAAHEVFPTWSSDGSHIAYTSCVGCTGDALAIATGGNSSIRTVNVATGVSAELVPVQSGWVIYYPEYSPDGRWLVYNKSRTDQSGGGNPSSYSSSTSELWIVPVAPDGGSTTGPARRLDNANGGAAANSWATWAPDSSFIAFASTRTGNWDVFVSAINATTGVDSPALALPYASTGNGEHIPAWGP